MDELVLKGNQGKTLVVAGDTIRIAKKGFLTGIRDKAIPIQNITSVEVKKPGGFVGFIQFSIAGSRARESSYTLSGGAYDAIQDENSVTFHGKDRYEIALRIKDYVESWQAKETPAPRRELSAADQVRELKALLDDGLLSEEEFEQKRREILNL